MKDKEIVENLKKEVGRYFRYVPEIDLIVR